MPASPARAARRRGMAIVPRPGSVSCHSCSLLAWRPAGASASYRSCPDMRHVSRDGHPAFRAPLLPLINGRGYLIRTARCIGDGRASHLHAAWPARSLARSTATKPSTGAAAASRECRASEPVAYTSSAGSAPASMAPLISGSSCPLPHLATPPPPFFAFWTATRPFAFPSSSGRICWNVGATLDPEHDANCSSSATERRNGIDCD